MTTQISGDTGVSQCQPNSVSQDDLQTGAKGLGIGQTWQDFNGIRLLDTVYTNSTAQPIMVNASAISSVGGNMSALVGTILLQGSNNGGPGGRGAITITVPAGATYSISMPATASSVSWKELRA